ncbi:MAG: hypothetical protein FJ044_04705 [Candidatus Cloacimonetes bacterium]|nr:hypothetical protein [Candidatus Cloacimonadota bacterium]
MVEQFDLIFVDIDLPLNDLLRLAGGIRDTEKVEDCAAAEDFLVIWPHSIQTAEEARELLEELGFQNIDFEKSGGDAISFLVSPPKQKPNLHKVVRFFRNWK